LSSVFVTASEGKMTMPEWNAKDQRQFKHIEDNELKSGSSEDEAAEIAARTVNKQRRKEGRTPNKTTQGTGNPNSRLKDRTVAELRNLAADAGIAGRSRMRKSELVNALARK
jgi:plasmid stabilization system protein ParE